MTPEDHKPATVVRWVRTCCSALFGSSIAVYAVGGHRGPLVIALVSLFLLAVIPPEDHNPRRTPR